MRVLMCVVVLLGAAVLSVSAQGGGRAGEAVVKVERLGGQRVLVTTTLPTWTNLYDWPAGHGYAGWQSTTSAAPGAYGMQTALGGNPGLWLWPVGGQRYGPGYAEWTYTAPGTTRVLSATIDGA